MSDDIKARLSVPIKVALRVGEFVSAEEALDHIEALEARVERLRETLESIYRWTVTSEDPEHICGWVEVEAREALAQDREKYV